uniref:Putative phosphatidyl-glycerophosphatase n=1 Tax=uncultured Acidobacteriota bacterium TaxID=171953 RepID=Q7X2U7_9BACT|nr:putative phosphatidyl-glycerophosphatase [uncultured Acidobacteriota bacterium]
MTEAHESSAAKRTFGDYLALAIATCGVGYLPLAPGTWGSLLAVGFYFLLHSVWFPHTDIPPGVFVRSYLVVQVLIIIAVTLVGVWAASRTERVLKIKDPGKVVIDEVAGQLIALLVLPGRLWQASDVAALVAAFILFRFFDIVKPYPARKLESLKGGWGIMTDDLVAGVYAAIVVAVIQAFHVFGSFS